jgi:hypothetical protein
MKRGPVRKSKSPTKKRPRNKSANDEENSNNTVAMVAKAEEPKELESMPETKRSRKSDNAKEDSIGKIYSL